MSTIEIRNLSKNFGAVRALNNVSATFAPDKIYGFLGRNGAGKTTLLNVVANRLFADAGAVFIDGEPAVENPAAQEKLFYMTEKNLYPEDMRVKEALRLAADFYPSFDATDAARLAERFELPLSKKITGLSTGYQSIFKLILTLAAGTPIALYDEPVLGLDPNHREIFYKELLAHYSARPHTVVLSTHLISEIAELFEEVVIIHRGEILAAQPVEQALRMAYTVTGAQEAVDEYAAGRKVIREELMGRYKAATIYEDNALADRAALARLGLDLSSPKLQELFVNLTNG